jgi:hypothetical protein
VYVALSLLLGIGALGLGSALPWPGPASSMATTLATVVALYVVGVRVLAGGVRGAAARDEITRRRNRGVDAAALTGSALVAAVAPSVPELVPAAATVVVGGGMALRLTARRPVLGVARRPPARPVVLAALPLLPFAAFAWRESAKLERLYALDATHAVVDWTWLAVSTVGLVTAVAAAIFLGARAIRAGRLPSGRIPSDGSTFDLVQLDGTRARVVTCDSPPPLGGQTVTVLDSRFEETGGSPYRRNVPLVHARELWLGAPADARRALALRAAGWLVWAGWTAVASAGSFVQLGWALGLEPF